MARLLVKAIDHTHPDPDKDKRGAYKRGDVVAVRDDDHVWGASEGPPKFEQVDLPGVDPSDLLYLSEEAQEDITEIISLAARKSPRLFNLLNKHKERNTTIRRRYKYDLDGGGISDKKRI
jgi:hypothetical protein